MPERAMVMAAGLGSRMRPLTDDRCKALVEVSGRPLVDWMLDHLQAVGVKTVVVNVHHFADRLEAHLAARRDGPEILISDERGGLLETGGGLVKAAPLLGEAPIFVANIDAVWTERGSAPSELARLAAGFDAGRMDFHLMLAERERTLGFSGAGDFHRLPDGSVQRRGPHTQAAYAYAGVQILHPRVLTGRAVEPFSTNRMWDEALARGRLFGLVMDAFWMHVGDPQARDAAQNRLALDDDQA